MTRVLTRLLKAGAAAFGFAAASAFAQTAICYNCPTEWADWGTQLKLIKEKTGITVPQDNKNSGQSLSQLVAEKANFPDSRLPRHNWPRHWLSLTWCRPPIDHLRNFPD